MEGPCASAREVFCTCSFECLIFKRQCSFLRALTEHIEYIKDEEISVMLDYMFHVGPKTIPSEHVVVVAAARKSASPPHVSACFLNYVAI